MPKFNSVNKVRLPSWSTPELSRMLVGHDRFYVYSDDHSAYTNGKEEERAMVKELQSIKPCSSNDALNIIDEIYRS